ncbi:MAG: phosphoribosylamine--glycine ligase, partial [bacterium]|nr:phosphoribosylamine--glycine ligase [bacterium]
MKVLVVGKGGREDALVWKIGQSPQVSEIYCAPGSDWIGQRPKTKCVGLKAGDIKRLASFAKSEGINLTVVGPEDPLVAGIVDEFQERKLRIAGPTRRAALIEGSKVWAKKFLDRNQIPTALFDIFDDAERAKIYARNNLPCVVKANGLAAGKGVFLCFKEDESSAAIERIMVQKEFKEAGDSVVIEEFLRGEEATFKVFTDGRIAIPLLATQDHKPVFDSDKGPNTGGMGAYAPAPVISKDMGIRIMGDIVEPILEG